MRTNKFTKMLLGAALLLSAMSQAQAEDKKVDPTGTYVWTQAGRNGGPDRTNTLTLKLDGDKLIGKVSSPGRGGAAADSEIADAKLIGAEVSFTVVRSFNGNSMTNKYTGTFADGAIKGKIESERNGQAQSRDWEAKAQK
jgi:opacity protein-like surface antigen